MTSTSDFRDLSLVFSAIVHVNPLTERLWLPPGPVCGGGDARCVLCDGPAVVRGGHRALHLPRQQPEAGVRVLGSWRAAQVPGHPGAALHWAHDLHADGLLRLHDVRAEGQEQTPSTPKETQPSFLCEKMRLKT